VIPQGRGLARCAVLYNDARPPSCRTNPPAPLRGHSAAKVDLASRGLDRSIIDWLTRDVVRPMAGARRRPKPEAGRAARRSKALGGGRAHSFAMRVPNGAAGLLPLWRLRYVH